MFLKRRDPNWVGVNGFLNLLKLANSVHGFRFSRRLLTHSVGLSESRDGTEENILKKF